MDTIAPSEKHLEEWLLKNPHIIIEDETGYSAMRQYPLPSGITDLIFFGGTHSMASPIILIELKKGKINAVAFAQACRYLRDLRAIGKIALDMMRNPYDGDLVRHDPRINGILIGHSIDDKNLLIAAEMAGITIMTYKYDSQTDNYEFETHECESLPLKTRYEYACDVLGQSIQQSWAIRMEELAKSIENNTPPVRDFIDGIDIYLLERDFGVVPYWQWIKTQETEDANESP